MIPALVLLAACDYRPPDTLDCETAGIIEGTLDAGDPAEIHRDDLVVSGLATSDRLAIRSIGVGNVPATPAAGATNFSSWTATLPIRTLVSLATDRGDGTGTVSLQAEYTDACGVRGPLGEPAEVRVDLTPTVFVDSLAMTVAVPGGRSFLPADGSAWATVTLTAGADAAGAAVTVTPSAGRLDPADGKVWLAGDGATAARAVLLFAGDGEDVGTAVLTATADGASTYGTLDLVGAPDVYPTTSRVLAGGTLSVAVSSDGELAECWWTAPNASDLQVSYGGNTATDGRIEFPAGTREAELILTAADPPSGETTLTLQCCDVHQQCLETAGSYTTAP